MKGSRRLLSIDRLSGRYHEIPLVRIAELFNEGDVLVLNDSATLPASLRGRLEDGSFLELRLTGLPNSQGHWPAIALGAGDWHGRTEDRERPPPLPIGTRLPWNAQVVQATCGFEGGHEQGHDRDEFRFTAPRIHVRFEGDPWKTLYEIGSPIQYAHSKSALVLHDVQTPYAGIPASSEMPSAGYPLRWSILSSLLRKGVVVTSLTHAAGISSTGNSHLDESLPFDEGTWIPDTCANAVRSARAQGYRIIAAGTSVVRALEGARLPEHPQLTTEMQKVTLRIQADTQLNVVDGILTGVHFEGESHFELLQSFLSKPQLLQALNHARLEQFKTHEFGDSLLLL